jgi:hypothetical protein
MNSFSIDDFIEDRTSVEQTARRACDQIPSFSERHGAWGDLVLQAKEMALNGKNKADKKLGAQILLMCSGIAYETKKKTTTFTHS